MDLERGKGAFSILIKSLFFIFARIVKNLHYLQSLTKSMILGTMTVKDTVMELAPLSVFTVLSDCLIFGFILPRSSVGLMIKSSGHFCGSQSPLPLPSPLFSSPAEAKERRYLSICEIIYRGKAE